MKRNFYCNISELLYSTDKLRGLQYDDIRVIDIKCGTLEITDILLKFKNLRQISIDARNIKGLWVIEQLSNIRVLNIKLYTQGYHLNLSKLERLKKLNMTTYSPMNTFDIHNLTALKRLEITGFDIEPLMLSNKQLTLLFILYSPVVKIDVSHMSGLKSLAVMFSHLNKFPALPDSIDFLKISHNRITSLPAINLDRCRYIDIWDSKIEPSDYYRVYLKYKDKIEKPDTVAYKEYMITAKISWLSDSVN